MTTKRAAILMGIVLVLIGILISTMNSAVGWMVIVAGAGSAAWIAAGGHESQQ